ncbi:MAG: ribosome maturation factor RimM [Anaerolineales bacterium]
MTTSCPNPRRSRHQKDETGSPGGGEPVFLAVGKLGRPHGVRGNIAVHILTGFPERLRPGVNVLVGPDHRVMRIRQAQRQNKTMRLAFDGVQNREQATELRNLMVFVRSTDVPPLPEGEYYHHQLIGLTVVADQGQELGQLAEIIETGANDVYLVRPPKGKDVLLPAIEEVILDVDLETGVLKVHLLPGLIPD